jgi:hypothetical protein
MCFVGFDVGPYSRVAEYLPSCLLQIETVTYLFDYNLAGEINV